MYLSIHIGRGHVTHVRVDEDGGGREGRRGTHLRQEAHLGNSKNTVRGYRLDIPRFDESLNN